MAKFDSGVSSYVEGVAIVRVSFPVDWRGEADISCNQCYYYRPATRRCALNGQVSEYPERYVGSRCPLEIGDGNGKRVQTFSDSDTEQGGV